MQFQLKYRGISHQHVATMVQTSLGETVHYRGANYQLKQPVNLKINSYNPTLVYRGVAYQKISSPEILFYTANPNNLFINLSLVEV